MTDTAQLSVKSLEDDYRDRIIKHTYGGAAMTDNEWARLISGSPKKAFEAMYEAYGGLVYAIAANKLSGCGSREDIEDCVSDIFVEIFRSAQRYSFNSGSMKAFVSTIAKRRAIDCFRKLARYGSATEELEDDTILPPASDDTEKEAEARIGNRELWDAVQSLGDPDTAIIVYQYFYDLSVNETAEKVGMTPAAVQKRSVRARAKIRTILEEGK